MEKWKIPCIRSTLNSDRSLVQSATPSLKYIYLTCLWSQTITKNCLLRFITESFWRSLFDTCEVIKTVRRLILFHSTWGFKKNKIVCLIFKQKSMDLVSRGEGKFAAVPKRFVIHIIVKLPKTTLFKTYPYENAGVGIFLVWSEGFCLDRSVLYRIMSIRKVLNRQHKRSNKLSRQRANINNVICREDFVKYL